MTTRKDALELLREDHEKVKHLLERLVETGTRGKKTREKLIEDIHRELEVHTRIEEEIFYPAVRAAADDREGEEMHFEFIEEHYLAGEVEVPRVMDVDVESDEFSARCSVLKELVTHHIEEEEERMFKRASKLLDKDELHALGREMSERKKDLLRETKRAA